MPGKSSPCLRRIKFERVVQFTVKETNFSFVLCIVSRGVSDREAGIERKRKETNRFR